VAKDPKKLQRFGLLLDLWNELSRRVFGPLLFHDPSFFQGFVVEKERTFFWQGGRGSDILSCPMFNLTHSSLHRICHFTEPPS